MIYAFTLSTSVGGRTIKTLLFNLLIYHSPILIISFITCGMNGKFIAV